MNHVVFFFNDTATTEIYTLSLHDALPICRQIELSLLKKNDTAQLSVKDNGPGIDKSQYENIWNRFYQVDESRNKEQNTGIGLGLSFVDKIAKIHGWKLDISENTHGGCTFTVTMETCTAAN